MVQGLNLKVFDEMKKTSLSSSVLYMTNLY